jgi:hypothetical protein
LQILALITALNRPRSASRFARSAATSRFGSSFAASVAIMRGERDTASISGCDLGCDAMARAWAAMASCENGNFGGEQTCDWATKVRYRAFAAESSLSAFPP